MTKVTYCMYPCDTCHMIREVMKMNGRDCAMCQKSRKREKMGIMRIVNDNKTRMNSVHLPHLKAKNVNEMQ